MSSLFYLQQREIFTIIFMAIVGAGVGSTYTYLLYTPSAQTLSSIWIGVVIGMLLGTFATFFEIAFISNPEAKIRTMPVLSALFFRISVHVVLIILITFLVPFISGQLGVTTQFSGLASAERITDTIFSILIVSGIVFIFQMRNFIGSRQLRNLLLGRYNKPQMENRIFMVVDISGSTEVAQKIGDAKFHAYLNRLFILFDEPIHKFGGEVHSYVGDAILAVWPLNDKPKNNERIFKAVREIVRICERKRDQFSAEFGLIPETKIAINAGEIAIGETGFRKRQITYLGNVLNLTFRLEAFVKQDQVQGDIVTTDYFLSKCEIPNFVIVTPYGEHVLKGSENPIDISVLNFNTVKN